VDKLYQIFFCMLPLAVAHFFSVGIKLCTSSFIADDVFLHIMALWHVIVFLSGSRIQLAYVQLIFKAHFFCY